MIFDSDVLIWLMHGNAKAADALLHAVTPAISVISYMELIQGARDKRGLHGIKLFLVDMGFRVLPLTESIGSRASMYLEQYRLSTGLGLTDALLAATTAEANETLLTGNDKHYRAIQDVSLSIFRP